MFLARELDTGWVAVTYCNWCLLSFSAICSSSFWRLPTCVFYPCGQNGLWALFRAWKPSRRPSYQWATGASTCPRRRARRVKCILQTSSGVKPGRRPLGMSEALPIDRAVRLSTWNDCPCVKYTVLRIGGTCSRYRQPGQGIATGQRDYSASAEKANSEIAPSCPEDLGSLSMSRIRPVCSHLIVPVPGPLNSRRFPATVD